MIKITTTSLDILSLSPLIPNKLNPVSYENCFLRAPSNCVRVCPHSILNLCICLPENHSPLYLSVSQCLPFPSKASSSESLDTKLCQEWPLHVSVISWFLSQAAPCFFLQAASILPALLLLTDDFLHIRWNCQYPAFSSLIALPYDFFSHHLCFWCGDHHCPQPQTPGNHNSVHPTLSSLSI